MKRSRRGIVVVLACLFIIVLIGILAFSLDVGYMLLVRTDLQGAADAAALAGAADLPQGANVSQTSARDYVTRNLGEEDGAAEVNALAGSWNTSSRTFVNAGSPIDAFEVTVSRNKTPLFFGWALGRNTANVTAKAVAIVRPRDIVLVLDFSGSMNEHRRIDQLKEAVAMFFSILKKSGTQDRVAFIRYSTQAEMAMHLTSNFDAINAVVQKTKADGWTNIGEGMLMGHNELTQNGRANAVKMMVMMTDGKVNRPANLDPRQFVLDQAQAIANDHISMVTISFGSDAEKSLMTAVAQITHGVAFDVEDSIKNHENELYNVFYKIAMFRPVALVD